MEGWVVLFCPHGTGVAGYFCTLPRGTLSEKLHLPESFPVRTEAAPALGFEDSGDHFVTTFPETHSLC